MSIADKAVVNEASAITEMRDIVAIEEEIANASVASAKSSENEELVKVNEDELDISQELQLQYRWSLWYSAPKSKDADQRKWDSQRLKRIVEFGTVKEFWQLRIYCLFVFLFKNKRMHRVFNNLSPPSSLGEGSDLHLFRSGVSPAWEDPFNTKGGTWKYTVSKDDANEKLNTCWFNTVLTMIGDQFHDADDICGIVTSIRSKVNRIGLWIKHADDREAVRRIGKQLKEINRIKTRIFFISHDDAKDYQRPNKSSEMTL